MGKVFISNRVITPQGMRPAAVVVQEERIIAVTQRDSALQSPNLLDFGDLVLMPGLVDTHVHINEPGRTEWEGFETATRAAAAGGITTLVDMPLNCLPETSTVDALEAKRSAAAGRCYIDWAAWGGLTDDNHAHILDLAGAGVRGFKCFLVDPGIEGLTMVTGGGLERAAPILAETGLPLLVHAELPGPIASAAGKLDGADWQRYETYLLSRPDAAEIEAIRLLLRLCRKYRFRLHIVHLSTTLALEELGAAQAEGLPITVETCPHYLHFAAEEIPRSATLLKCAPPIRSAANREALWDGLQKGTIHLIATDHSPCPPAMKRREEGDFRKAWGGISSLSIAASVIWTGMRERGIPLQRLPQWMAQTPAALAGLSAKKGAIAPGMDADLVVFDPDAKFEVAPPHLHYRHKVSAYLGQSLYGVVERTFLRGDEIYNKGAFPALSSGQEQVLLHSRP
jgi:allantoinase